MTKKTMTLNLTDHEIAELERLANPRADAIRAVAYEEAAKIAEAGDWYGSFQTVGDERRAQAIAARIRALILTPETILEGKAEAFDQIVAARKKYVEAAKTYNARRDLANAERMRGSWAIKLDTEYRAMSDAQAEYHRTVQGLVDAAIATSEGSDNA